MKLLNTLSVMSVLGLTSFVYAEEAQKEAKAPCKEGICEASACADSTTFMVTGMTCTSCTGKVATALSAIEGVSEVKVCHKSGKACMKLDEAKTDKSKVMAAINTTGFKVAGEALTIPVSGMTCGACSKKVAAALTSLEGCSSVSVCDKSGQASLVIDGSKTTEAKVIEAINASGFKAAAAKSKVKG